MHEIKVVQEIDSGHQLKLPYDSKCNGKHGHRWKVIVTLESKWLNDWGMVVDFTHVKAILKLYDHVFFEYSQAHTQVQFGTEGIVFVPFQPTAENLAQFFAEEIETSLASDPLYPHAISVTSVELWETPSGCTVYRKSE